jgi:hypothetical protein
MAEDLSEKIAPTSFLQLIRAYGIDVQIRLLWRPVKNDGCAAPEGISATYMAVGSVIP